MGRFNCLNFYSDSKLSLPASFLKKKEERDEARAEKRRIFNEKNTPKGAAANVSNAIPAPVAGLTAADSAIDTNNNERKKYPHISLPRISKMKNSQLSQKKKSGTAKASIQIHLGDGKIPIGSFAHEDSLDSDSIPLIEKKHAVPRTQTDATNGSKATTARTSHNPKNSVVGVSNSATPSPTRASPVRASRDTASEHYQSDSSSAPKPKLPARRISEPARPPTPNRAYAI